MYFLLSYNLEKKGSDPWVIGNLQGIWDGKSISGDSYNWINDYWDGLGNQVDFQLCL